MAVSAKTRVRKTFPRSGKLVLVKRYVDLAMHCAGDARADVLSSHPLLVCRQEHRSSGSLSGWGANWGSARIMEEMKNDKDAVIASDGG